MKLESFKEKKNKKKAVYIGMGSIILLLAAIFVYRTYSIYQESQEFDVIKGSVPDQNYDIMFIFYLIDEEGNKTISNTIPEGKDYNVTINCNNEAVGVWDKEAWGPRISNLTTTRTKCNVNFEKLIFPLREYGIEEPVIKEGCGIYKVSHEDAEITYTSDTTAIDNLKMTEYRYACDNPNNYVTFNEEEAGWRIIGLVNTPEGQRLKLIRDESIGKLSWDTSSMSINSGYGVNEWSTSKIKELLNDGAYYNRGTSTSCYYGRNNASTSCGFKSNGLTEDAKEMIDTVTWTTGAIHEMSSSTNNNTIKIYNDERSSNLGKICSGGTLCNDKITRTTSWIGQVGLMYPSDYGYATSGGDTINRNSCLNMSIYQWNSSDVGDCKNNNWLYDSSNKWTITPSFSSIGSHGVEDIQSTGKVDDDCASNGYQIHPSIYLKQNVKIIDGNGTKENPYQLSAN